MADNHTNLTWNCTHFHRMCGVQSRDRPPCKSCNARRVKCDVSESQPCWHCRVREQPCELIESRRGRYQRVRNKGAGARRRSEATSIAESTIAPSQDASTIMSLQEDHTRMSVDSLLSANPAAPQHMPSLASIEESAIGIDTCSSVDGPEMLFARMTEVQPAEDRTPDIREQSRTLYLGETFSLAFVVKTVCHPSQTGSEVRNHYPIPLSVADRLDRRDDPAKSFLQHEDVFLQAQGAFTTLPKALSDELVAVFFRYFHPAWPVFDRRHFAALYERDQASLLALQTIYFIAFSICDENLLHRAGFFDRYQARRVFYLRAKGLYDADYEKNKVILAAVLFLLGFWWLGPEDQKDTWYWLGCAVSLAQTLGMHRSTAQGGMDPRQRSLWKRIFWCIYTRDRHAAAALGRPFRINDDDCDVEELCEADFELDIASESPIMATQKSYHVQYQIAITKLAGSFGRIMSTRYRPHGSNTQAGIKSIGDELARWKAALPREMLLQDIDRDGAGFWSSMLHANFYTCQILLFRPSRVIVETDQEIQNDRIARAAADGMTRIAEDLLTSGMLRQAQVHMAPALFAACGMHAIVIRRKCAIQSQVAENRARQCMLALSELAKSWPVANWILRLFISLMTRLTGHDFKDIHPNNAVDGLELGPHQEGYPNDPSEHSIEVGHTLPQMADTGNPWHEDLGPEDLNWIFQDSLGDFSLYDLSLQNEAGSTAF
ncbi:fungal-specific transcription factor domain-containing protein [Exophiala viscosa]|uniref:fungal-specific transcription factor domain-containing protein n=1 Tax=Exophiala viscosa TaxID=2486360 RepID=UPI0021927EE8|nr:fungal-specific transcription factor domain-containing protein [Exophiala viscosa]